MREAPPPTCIVFFLNSSSLLLMVFYFKIRSIPHHLKLLWIRSWRSKSVSLRSPSNDFQIEARSCLKWFQSVAWGLEIKQFFCCCFIEEMKSFCWKKYESYFRLLFSKSLERKKGTKHWKSAENSKIMWVEGSLRLKARICETKRFHKAHETCNFLRILQCSQKKWYELMFQETDMHRNSQLRNSSKIYSTRYLLTPPRT